MKATATPLELRRAGRQALAAALGILLLRLVAFGLTRSLAVLADSIEPFLNLAAAVVTLLGVREARRPADETHPFGHFKLEFVAVGFHGAMALCGVVVVAGMAAFQWIEDWPVRPQPVALGLFGLSIVLSAALAGIQSTAGRRHGSPALIAAGHHARLDTAIACGVLLSLLVADRPRLDWLDPVGSVAICAVIAWGALRLLRQAAFGLMDTADAEVRARCENILRDRLDDQLIGFHDIRCRDAGGLVYLDFHLQFAAGCELEEAHYRAELAEAAVEAAIGRADATAHLEPASELREDRGSVPAARGEREIARRRAAATSLITAVTLFALKFAAYLVTKSAAVLSDALESTVNVVAAALALYSVIRARSGSDDDHPFGHHKIEFLAAGLEGGLILVAALAIVVSAVARLLSGAPPEQVELGALLLLVASLVNGALGLYLLRAGRRLNSLTLIADGRHVLSDVWTSVAVIAGLVVVKLTGWVVADPLMALAMAGYIVWTGAGLTREALRGVLDTVRPEQVARAAEVLNGAQADGRIVGWHQLRVRDAGSYRFADAHIQLPPGCGLAQAHDVSEQLEDAIEEALRPAGAILHAEPHTMVRPGP